MRSDEICHVLARLERDNEVNKISYQGFKLWPLIRFCIWTELNKTVNELPVEIDSISNSVRSSGLWLRRGVYMASRLAPRAYPGVKSLFISHTVNLQLLPGAGLWFDRIADPLYFLAKNREKVEKLYVSPMNQNGELYFPARYLRPVWPILNHDYSLIRYQLVDLYQQAGLPSDSVDVGLYQSWRRFTKWQRMAGRFFDASPDLQKVYLSNWYFPEMMGVIAAARERGILTIDLQHGKQGRYQGMYSWWTRIPKEGYGMMPDNFWCWGKPSCEHILASSSDRKQHLPIVGGFPWPDFYRRFLSMDASSSTQGKKASRRVLVTLQGPIGLHLEPIPDFIVNYLRSDSSLGDVFVFRPHPNFFNSRAYCEERLQGVPPDRYIIGDGVLNLYDEMLSATHHITAFSSCCYEAEMFGVPTLLFGAEAKVIYEEEIKAQRYTWSAGEQSELAKWLVEAPTPSIINERGDNNYIVASLRKADSLMQSLPQARNLTNLQNKK